MAEPAAMSWRNPWVRGSVGVLAASALLFVVILARAHFKRAEPAEFNFGVAAHPGLRPPLALNGFALWVAMMIGLTVVNYGYPIVQLALLKEASVPVVPIGSR